MERKLKFRGRNIHTGEWLYGDYHREGKTHYITKPGDYLREYAPIEFLVDEKTIGQFTGMLDKNGKEIYEGDIVRISIWPTEDTAKTNTRNAELTGIEMPSWIDGGDIIARVSYFDCAFQFIHLQSYLPPGSKNTQEPMLNYLFNERYPDVPTHYNQEITVISNIHDNPKMLNEK